MSVVERAYIVTLTIPDNEAFTALGALVRMGVSVAQVVRADVWVATVDAEQANALDALVPTIETIFNPNKHRLDIRTQAHPASGEVWIAPTDEAPATTLAGRSLPGVRGIVRRTSWRLLDAGGNDVPAEALQRAISEFLCNPAFQKAIYQS